MSYSGSISIIGNKTIKGWVKSSSNKEPLVVEVVNNGQVIASIVADEKLADGSNEDQLCGFTYEFEEYSPSVFLGTRIRVQNTTYYILPNTDFRERIINHLVRNSINIAKYDGVINKESRKCFLHIGMHKTGSSSIQQYLQHNPSYSDVEYLESEFANHSIPFYSIFTVYPEKYHVNRRRDFSYYECLHYNRKTLIEMSKFLQQSERDIIISGEDISVLKQKELTKLRGFLFTFFETVEVIVYVRAPHAFLVSNFQESVKGGVVSGMNFNNLSNNTLYPDYRKVIEKFTHVFGEGSLTIRLFDKKHLIKEDVVHDFLSIVGVEAKNNLVRSNESLSLEELSVMYIYNKYVLSKTGLNQQINTKLSKLRRRIQPLAKNKFRVASEVTQDVIDQNYDDLVWLVDRLTDDVNLEDLIPNSMDSGQEVIISNEEQLERIGWEQFEKLIGIG